MRSAESILYSDIEKYHRVLGYYKHQKQKPTQLHESFIDKNLEVFLRNPSQYIRRIRYELGMSEASSEKQVVYRAEKPEISLTFSLYSEGVHSLSILRELRASELGRWCQLVEESIENFETGGDDDLASILWRYPFRNIRTKISNGLTDLAADIKSKDTLSMEDSWHFRDSEWSLPSAENVKRDSQAAVPMGQNFLREFITKLSNREYVEDNQNSLQLTSSEILALSEEMSGFDENHVDFNFLNLCFSCFRDPKSLQNQLLMDSFRESIDSILERFQPSLILYLLEKIEKSSLSPEILTEIKAKISESLMKPENEEPLLSSLMNPSRAELTRRLFPYLSPKQIPHIIQFFIKQNDKDGLVSFLREILALHEDFNTIIFSLDSNSLVSILPLFRQLDWPTKYELLSRCLRAPQKDLSKMAAYYAAGMNLGTKEALEIYSKSSDETKEIWQRALLESKVQESWRAFVIEMSRDLRWMEAKNPQIRNRLALGWIQCLAKYESEKVVSIFLPLIKKRKLLLFPEFPEEREIILNAFLDSEILRKSQGLKALIQEEASLRFQSKELKTRLSLRAKMSGGKASE